MPNKKVIVSVINDLVTDQRVARTCSVFRELNYQVLLVGRKKRDSLNLQNRDYTCKRMMLFFESGPLFYVFFNLRLFFVLLFNKTDVLFANDLDTLLPNYLISKIKNVPLIYDSHEVFCEVPELKDRHFKRKIWLMLEKWLVPKLTYAVTVNKSIADYFNKKYQSQFIFIRNIPDINRPQKIKSRQELDLPSGKNIVLLQGSGINIDRGAEELVESFQYLNDDYLLLIIGSGDVLPLLKEKVVNLKIQNKVRFIDKIPSQELIHYTTNSNLGVSIDKDSNMNYHFSLPNKLFDYIYAGIPLLATRLPEIEYIVSKYQIGVFIDNHDPKHIAHKISDCIASKEYQTFKLNTKNAASDNTWQNEKQKLVNLINALSD